MPGSCSRPAGPERTARGSAPGPVAKRLAHNRGNRGYRTVNRCTDKAGSWPGVIACDEGTILVPIPRRLESSIVRAIRRVAARELVDAEVWVLTTDAGSRLLAEIAQVRSIRPADIARFRKWAAPELVSAAIRRVDCTRARPQSSLSTGRKCGSSRRPSNRPPRRLVARHKATRFTCPLVVDLCAGIGGDAIALAGAIRRAGRRSRSGHVPSAPL